MTDTMRERMTEALVWARDRGLDADDPRTVDAVLDAMAGPTEGMIHHGASALDYPSVYMGGPSFASVRSAGRTWRAMVKAARGGE